MVKTAWKLLEKSIYHGRDPSPLLEVRRLPTGIPMKVQMARYGCSIHRYRSISPDLHGSTMSSGAFLHLRSALLPTLHTNLSLNGVEPFCRHLTLDVLKEPGVFRYSRKILLIPYEYQTSHVAIGRPHTRPNIISFEDKEPVDAVGVAQRREDSPRS